MRNVVLNHLRKLDGDALINSFEKNVDVYNQRIDERFNAGQGFVEAYGLDAVTTSPEIMRMLRVISQIETELSWLPESKQVDRIMSLTELLKSYLTLKHERGFDFVEYIASDD